MKKRTFTYVLALITIVCLLASSASATAPDTLNGDTIQRRLTTPSPRISESILSPFVTLPNKIFSLFMRKNWNGSSRPPLNITTL